jgi:cytoskeletal protein CcmA (bactofilin family)
MRKLAAGLVLAVSIGVLPAPPALAEEFVCRRTVGAVTLDNVKVPSGRTCVLEGTYVKGTIKVERNATLRAKGVRVIGNVQAEDAANVVVKAGSRIGGSIQIVQGGRASVLRSRINGDILYDDNSKALSAIRNTIGGNLQAFQNTGGVEIRRNRIDGNLQCKENRPAPTGGNNIVQGSKEDQCKRL